VSSSAILKAVLALVAILSVASKIYFFGQNEAPLEDFTLRAAAVLQGHQFVTQVLPAGNAIYRAVAGRNGSCQLTVASIAAHGWERDSIWRSARPGDQVLFIYHGRRYPDQPVWRTWADYYLNRATRLIAQAKPLAPVVALIASPDCDVSAMRWLEQLS
jgi:hypothetical protein